MKNIKYVVLVIISLIIFNIKVNAASYDMILEKDSGTISKGSNVDLYVTLKNISGISDGILTCEFSLENGTNVTINSLTGVNSWNVTEGEKIVIDTTPGVTSNTRAVKINATINGDSTLKLTSVNCTDGEEEYSASDYTLYLSVTEKESTQTNSSYVTSSTVSQEKTGVEEIFISLLILAAIAGIVIALLNKKNKLFKKSI